MATYDGTKYIRKQLDDLAAQTRLPAELVICDDQSSDDTLEVVQDFAASAPFPVHIHVNSARLGYRANFIKCAGLCTSDLIAFCDQDDRWNPRKLELLAAAFADDEVLLAYHNAKPVTEDGRSLPLIYRGQDETRCPALSVDPWFNPLGFTQMFHRSLLGFEAFWLHSSDQNQEGEPLAHDQWYFLLASAFGSIVYLPDVLADYRQHDANAYGVSWYKILAPRLTELWHATHEGKQRLDAAEGRARIFRQMSQRLSGKLHERSYRAASWYDHLSVLVRTRSELYNSASLAKRTSALKALVRGGGYGVRPPSYPRLTIAMDATVGIAGLFSLVEDVTRRVTRR